MGVIATSGWEIPLKTISTCSEEGCDRPSVARGLCGRDYERRKRSDTLPPITCPVPDCINESNYTGRPCRTHLAEFESIGMKWCTAPGCAERLKPLSNFSSNGGRTYSWCKPCNRIKGQKYHTENEGYPGSHHGLSPGEYREMLAAQGGKCAICEKEFDRTEGRATTPCIDHDHSCCPGRLGCPECVRALLCYGCNIMLAHDDPEILRRWRPTRKRPRWLIDAGIAYLEHWHAVMAVRGIRPSVEDTLWQDVFGAVTRLIMEIA